MLNQAFPAALLLCASRPPLIVNALGERTPAARAGTPAHASEAQIAVIAKKYLVITARYLPAVPRSLQAIWWRVGHASVLRFGSCCDRHRRRRGFARTRTITSHAHGRISHDPCASLRRSHAYVRTRHSTLVGISERNGENDLLVHAQKGHAGFGLLRARLFARGTMGHARRCARALRAGRTHRGSHRPQADVLAARRPRRASAGCAQPGLHDNYERRACVGTRAWRDSGRRLRRDAHGLVEALAQRGSHAEQRRARRRALSGVEHAGSAVLVRRAAYYRKRSRNDRHGSRRCRLTQRFLAGILDIAPWALSNRIAGEPGRGARLGGARDGDVCKASRRIGLSGAGHRDRSIRRCSNSSRRCARRAPFSFSPEPE